MFIFGALGSWLCLLLFRHNLEASHLNFSRLRHSTTSDKSMLKTTHFEELDGQRHRAPFVEPFDEYLGCRDEQSDSRGHSPVRSGVANRGANHNSEPALLISSIMKMCWV